MQPNMEKLSFGELLREAREKSVDRRSRMRLSQDHFASKLTQKLGFIVTRNRVSNWETNKTRIQVDDRKILMAVLTVLHDYGGIAECEEADQLLEAGGYRTLNEEEALKINPEWKPNGLVGLLIESATEGSDSSSPGNPGNGIPSSGPLVENATKQLKEGLHVELYSDDCGDAPINLAQQRLLVSTSFGSYFAGLLERPNLYIDLESQIDCPAPKRQAGLPPLQRIFWLLEYPKGPRTMIIGGEGGMGKSTLSAKIVRCLYQEQAIDLILGDSAKSEHVDPITREIVQLPPGYYDSETFYNRIGDQLGLPGLSKRQAVNAIKDRLVGRRAVIVVDNLEIVKGGDEILDSLKIITSRDVRAIVTTRKVTGVKKLDSDLFVVQLQPLTDLGIAERFLLWHIEQYQYQHPALRELRKDIKPYIKWMIDRTGGIPLLMQLVLSDAARYSWDYVEMLPSLFGEALLNFLYQARWDDLGSQNQEGEVAKQLLKWIAQEQYRGQLITSKQILDWAKNYNIEMHLSGALSLLFERFMIINRDPVKGNFSIYPSLVEFLGNRYP
jgi:transcriptional regulator with XRE-family HTH domain